MILTDHIIHSCAWEPKKRRPNKFYLQPVPMFGNSWCEVFHVSTISFIFCFLSHSSWLNVYNDNSLVPHISFFSLEQNYPIPFRTKITMQFALTHKLWDVKAETWDPRSQSAFAFCYYRRILKTGYLWAKEVWVS